MPSELYPSDKLVLKVCGGMEIERGERGADLDTDTILENVEQEGVGREQAAESIEALNEGGFIKAIYTTSEVPFVLTVTDVGFDQYGRTFLPDYNSRRRAVEDQIANHDKRERTEIADALDESPVIVERIIGLLATYGDVELFHDIGPLRISNVSTGFKRRLRSS